MEDADGNVAYEVTDIVQEEMKDTKYKVRVTDKSTGKTYVRMADREKIGQLRADPRISSVEMTGYGDSYDKPVGKGKGEEEKKETAKEETVKDPKGLLRDRMSGTDSKATLQMDLKTKSAYQKARGAVIAANELRKDIKSLKGGETTKEEFIHEVNVEDDNPEANTKKIDVMKGKNKIIINPTQSEQMKPGEDTSAEKTKESSSEKRIRMVKRKILQQKMQAVRQGAGADVVAHTEYEGEHISEKAGCAHTHEGTECSVHGKDECPPESSSKKEKEDTDDYRSMPTKVNMVRNKLRAMGLKMSYEPKGNEIDEEASDAMKDRRMERGGVGGNIRYDKAPKPTNTAGKKKPYDGMSAVEKVKASIRAKYGQGAIMDTKKK